MHSDCLTWAFQHNLLEHTLTVHYFGKL